MRGAMAGSARALVGNRILAGLPPADRKRLQPHLETVELRLGQVLHEPGARIAHCYFPEDGFISLLTVLAPNKAAEVGIVGQEGAVGSSAAVGIRHSQLRALVQGAGSAQRISATRLQDQFGRSDSLRRGLFHFNSVLLGQFAQTAACNRFHNAEKRLARWLLVTRDRLRSDSFHLTHQFLSQMLGVRRVGVTNAAGSLARRHLISYSRGNVRILDGKGLEAASCGCYGAVKAMGRAT